MVSMAWPKDGSILGRNDRVPFHPLGPSNERPAQTLTAIVTRKVQNTDLPGSLCAEIVTLYQPISRVLREKWAMVTDLWCRGRVRFVRAD